MNGLKDTHKSWWECETGIAYLVGGDPAWRTPRMTKIYDLSDPAHPVFIRDFGLPGQQPGSTMNPVPTEVHGPISIPKANRVYFGYGTGRYGVVQIVDRKKLLEGPKEPTDANLRYPVVGQLDLPIDVGAHTAFPVLHMMLPEYRQAELAAGRHQHGGGHARSRRRLRAADQPGDARLHRHRRRDDGERMPRGAAARARHRRDVREAR